VAFRSFTEWTAPRRAERIVTRLLCIGDLTAQDVDEIAAMKDLQQLTLQGIETFPSKLCSLGALRQLTINKRGEPGVRELPEEIRELRNLHTLRVRAQRLTMLPESIAELDALAVLDLRHSGVRSLPTSLMEAATSMRICVAR